MAPGGRGPGSRRTITRFFSGTGLPFGGGGGGGLLCEGRVGGVGAT